MSLNIPYYEDYLSPELKNWLLETSRPVKGVDGLKEIGERGGLETPEALAFLCELYTKVAHELNEVLEQRKKDRAFIDERTKACVSYNQKLDTDFLSSQYKTILGLEDAQGRIVMGPKIDCFWKATGKSVATIPEFLQGPHVTLFGPPDNAKLSINAMNAYHRKLKDEPAIVEELLKSHKSVPKWGADDEDSKTPLREDLIAAGENLTHCLDGKIDFIDEETQKKYELQKDHLSLPIKRFPGLALPSFFLFYQGEPLPLHLYDFALHLFRHWHNPKALAFYVPKLENEEEARYLKHMLETAEKMIKKIHSSYEIGTIKLMIVLENPRAIFRVNEIMDELHPYFAGASLGWHDYLASTARLFKEDAQYRIPVKADPNIVIKYSKASHELLAQVVGPRGGIKVGGMYGVLPNTTELHSPSFQVTLKGFIRDILTQMKRDLTGFWVAHPDFVRLGLALVEGWKLHSEGNPGPLKLLITSLLDHKEHAEMLKFISDPDQEGLDPADPLYPRSLIVADTKGSSFIANNHPDEIRYNIFQSLQYLADWLSGNGCVALPAHVNGTPVRVMDDLATAERSRWEVWHELHHGRFSIEEFLKIAHEELLFIRKDMSHGQKLVQVKWDERTEKWYPLAFKLMVKLMTDHRPREFATELLLPFTIPKVREAISPWEEVLRIDPRKYQMREDVKRFNYYFENCGSLSFATEMAKLPFLDKKKAAELIMKFSLSDILEAASFHGDIGQGRQGLDHMASLEQAKVLNEKELIRQELVKLGEEYLQKFSMKFLISAQGKSGEEILQILKERLKNTQMKEMDHAREALKKITLRRIHDCPVDQVQEKLESLLQKHGVKGAMVSVSSSENASELFTLGEGVTPETWFELASLSKSVASAFALEYFAKKKIPLSTPVNTLFEKTSSPFRLKTKENGPSEWAQNVTLSHLMNHSALNMHYVNGVPASKTMPPIEDFLEGNNDYNYPPVRVIHPPGEVFQYSGGGFLVLEHLIEALEKKSIPELTRPFLNDLGMKNFSFEQKNLPGQDYARGHLDSGAEVEGGRKMFPAFAAGAMGNASSMEAFLKHLTKAFHSLDGSGPLSHDTAIQMLYGKDLGCRRFMGTMMGLGVFTIEAQDNKFALHQGANDGFRCLYLHCYQGPDQGKGFVILCNSELSGVLFIAEVAQLLLQELQVTGIDYTKFKTHFKSQDIPQEEVVNIGYKNLVFDAFRPARAEEIIRPGERDSLSDMNLAVGAKVLEVSNERFARAENLFSPNQPKFEPDLFGTQGKIMDSWESVRHNQASLDFLTFELKKLSPVSYVSFSTKYHLGNQPQFVKLDGLDPTTQEWEEIVPKIPLEGHALKRVKTKDSEKNYHTLRVSMFPDGGLTRLGLYGEDLPTSLKSQFALPHEAKSEMFEEKIPAVLKPLTIKFSPSPLEIENNLKKAKSKNEFDNACSAFGGKIIRASNEHYGPAVQVISPFRPLNMFDGLESARSRQPGHSEEVIIGLAHKLPVHRIEIDFTFFVNNNPWELAIEGFSDGQWIPLVSKTNVKGYAGKQRSFEIQVPHAFEQIKVVAFPDGGMNRIRVFSRGRA